MSSTCAAAAGNDAIALMYKLSGTPLENRSQTIQIMEALLDDSRRDGLSNVYGPGPLVLSDIPDSAKQEGVLVGIDEAGRGSVLGPMIYGAAYWHPSVAESIPKDFNDSKQLTEEKRALLLQEILYNTPAMGFAVRVLHASEIARNMLRPTPYNLNQMSHDAAIEIIRKLLEAGVKITTCFIDTVGNPQSCTRRLESEFPGLSFVVESKADANYPPCSAGSVVAKNVRDRMTKSWRFSEQDIDATTNFGSGYPSDPTCKKWMDDHQKCKIFGYPDVVRFSWAPAKKALEEKAVHVLFEADVDDDDDSTATTSKKRQQEQMSIFLGKQPTKAKRYPFFERRRMNVVSKLG
jgi:ribonuclease H2 subunit A